MFPAPGGIAIRNRSTSPAQTRTYLNASIAPGQSGKSISSHVRSTLPSSNTGDHNNSSPQLQRPTSFHQAQVLQSRPAQPVNYTASSRDLTPSARCASPSVVPSRVHAGITEQDRGDSLAQSGNYLMQPWQFTHSLPSHPGRVQSKPENVQRPNSLAAPAGPPKASLPYTSITANSASSIGAADPLRPGSVGRMPEFTGVERERLSAEMLHRTAKPVASPRMTVPEVVAEMNSMSSPAAAGNGDFSPSRPGESYLLAPASAELSIQLRVRELEARIPELERVNRELEQKMDDDGRQFLEALISLETEVEELTKTNKQLSDERTHMEEQIRGQGSDGELLAKSLKMERDSEDVLQQLEEFEKEKEEELRLAHAEMDRLTRKLSDQEGEFRRKLNDMERDRINLVEAMTEEGKELQSRVEKLNRDKEALSLDLAKALARADVANAGADSGRGDGGEQSSSAQSPSQVLNQLRIVEAERETLKDEVTNKDGQLVLLQNKFEITERKLRLADIENSVMKSELEVLKRNANSGNG